MGIDSNVEEHFPQEPPIDTGNKTTQADAGLNQQAGRYKTSKLLWGPVDTGSCHHHVGMCSKTKYV